MSRPLSLLPKVLKHSCRFNQYHCISGQNCVVTVVTVWEYACVQV